MPAVTPTSVGAVDTPDVLPVDQATAIAATQSYAQQAQAALAAAATLADFANKYAGAYSSDPTYVGPTPPWVIGSLYFNTISGKLRVWKSAIVMGMPTIDWHDYDESAVASAADAAASASAAAIREANAAASAAAAASASAAALAGSTAFRNRIINGNFDIWQRGTSFSISTGSLTYTNDRWFVQNDSGNTATVTQNAAPSGFRGANANRIQAPLGAGSVIGWCQRFEGQMVRDLDGKDIVVSFDLSQSLSGGATATWYLQIFGNTALDNGTFSTTLFSTTFTPPASAGVVSIAIPAVSTVGIKYGAHFRIVAVRTSGSGNFDAYLGAVQFEEDRQIAGAWGNPTPFEFRPFSVELAMCQRFYQLSPRLFGFALDAVNIVVMWTPIVPMRAAPTAVLSTLTPAGESPPFSAAFTASSATLDASHIVSGVSGGDLRVHGFSGLTTNAPATLGAGAIALSAEL